MFSRKDRDQKEFKWVISLFYIKFDKNFLKGFAVESLINQLARKLTIFLGMFGRGFVASEALAWVLMLPCASWH